MARKKKKICQAKTRSGRKCSNRAIKGKSFCKIHTREARAKRQMASAIKRGYKPQFAGNRTVEKYDYQNYLKSSGWKTKADKKKKENPNCSLCNRRGVLHVHHRTYVRCGSEANNDLVVLCSDCHELFHDNYDYREHVGYFSPKK